MKRSTKVVLVVVGAVVALLFLNQFRMVAKASALGIPAASAAKIAMGGELSCEERASMGLAVAERHCRSTDDCRWDAAAMEEGRRHVIELCKRQGGR